MPVGNLSTIPVNFAMTIPLVHDELVAVSTAATHLKDRKSALSIAR
jgi:hypothetical protein